jgi:uncharacterized protein (TIGR02145 family)
MKIKILLIVLLIGMIMGTYAQKPTITLTFTAGKNGQYIPLDSILIGNLTLGGDTTLYAPDTLLVLDYLTGFREVNHIGANSFTLFQNYPNPVQGSTTVDLYVPGNKSVIITLNDMMGRELIQREYPLVAGNHSFTFFPGSESLYFLTARIDCQSQTIKLFNAALHASEPGICKLEYKGVQTGFDKYKSGNNLNNFVFNQGDQLKYTASSALGEQTIIDSPTGSQTYTFLYTSGIPCPGIPTITDIDGNIYNTIQIGNHCWMKENLKTTTYQNGLSIPNVTDDNAWYNLISGAYVWYDNDISWKDKYGALYNWYATIDPNGLCPSGWRVPTNDEWTALTDFIGGTGDGNELKSCRQVNSPPGGSCNTSEHPRWKDDPSGGNYGSDDYGFSGLPGGGRYGSGYFGNIGTYSSWWSYTEYSASIGRVRSLSFGYGSVFDGGYSKRSGFSVRCLKD